MRKMVCIRNCHGFRGGYWSEGEVVDAADGETVPRHFIPLENYEDFKNNKDVKNRPDPMKVNSQIHPIPPHLQGRGGISNVSTLTPKPGSDI